MCSCVRKYAYIWYRYPLRKISSLWFDLVRIRANLVSMTT